MALRDTFSSGFSKSYVNASKQLLRTSKIETIEKSARAVLTQAQTYSSNSPVKQGIDYGPYRQLSNEILRRMYLYNNIVRVCVDNIIKTVIAAEWDIRFKHQNMVLDPKQQQEIDEVRQKIKEFFINPNEQAETFTQLLEKVLVDLLVLDFCVIEKVINKDGELKEIYAVDASSIKQDIDNHGRVKRYQQFPEGFTTEKTVINFSPREIIFMVWHPTTFSLYGTPILETIEQLVAGFLHSQSYNLKYFENNATPRGILDLGVYVNEDELDRFREYWSEENIQQPHRVMVVGGPITGTPEKPNQIKWLPIAMSTKDMDLMNYLNWLVKMLLIAFGLTEQEIGLQASNAPATTHYLQGLAFKNKTIAPLLKMISQFFTEHIVHMEFKRPDLQFEFVEELSIQEKQQDAQYNQLRIMSGEATADEVRKEKGKPPAPKEGEEGGGGAEESQQFGEDYSQEDAEIDDWLNNLRASHDLEYKSPEDLKEDIVENSRVQDTAAAFESLKQAVHNAVKTKTKPTKEEAAIKLIEAVNTVLKNRQATVPVDKARFLKTASTYQEAIQTLVSLVHKFIDSQQQKVARSQRKQQAAKQFERLVSALENMNIKLQHNPPPPTTVQNTVVVNNE